MKKIALFVVGVLTGVWLTLTAATLVPDEAIEYDDYPYGEDDF